MTARSKVGMGRRAVLAGMGTALAASFVSPTRAGEVLFVNTWGGPWEEAARAFLFDPFTKATGIEIRTIAPVSYAKLAAQVRTGVYEFDVTTLGVAELGRANLANLIEKADAHALGETNWPGAIVMNGVASHAFANAIAWRKDRFPNGGPWSWAEFWDTQKFPGARSLQNYPARVLAFALLADGVEPKALFPYDLDRAFASLDRIKKDVRVWWSQGPQSQQLLRDGEVDAIAMWSTSVKSLIDQKVPVELVLNQAVLDVAFWVVARATPRAKNAWRFIQFAVQPENLAKFAMKNNYGPMNPGSFDFIPASEAQAMPTYQENLATSIVLDPEKLLPQLDEMAKRFERWLAS